MASAMQCFCFLVKFGLALIYTLKLYHRKSSSTLLRKNMFNSLICSNHFEKHVSSQVLKDLSVENSETTPSIFLLKFSSEIYLTQTINY